MLAAKVHRQPTDSTIAPPIAGPAAAATPPSPPVTPTAVARRSGPKASSIRASIAGPWKATPAACTTRAATKSSTVGARATRPEPSRNTANPVANIRARPYRSAAQPPGTINAPMVIENAVSAQDTVVPSASKVSAISPKATKLIEKFSAVSTMALPTTENSRHGEVGAVVAVSVTPAGYTTFGRAVETVTPSSARLHR